MDLHLLHTIDRFCVVGISYKKADFELRSRYSLSQQAKETILYMASEAGLKSLFIVSTCNRTELYGYAPSPSFLLDLLINNVADGSADDIVNFGYQLNGYEAFNHAFRVGAGLDSQIIGDFEIAGQMKHAVEFSKKRSMVGPILDRTFNFIQQASKKIKNQTAISTGTVSVSFAAIDWLKPRITHSEIKILVVGTGKFGTGIIKNLLHYFPNNPLTICNRTFEKAAAIAQEFNVHQLDYNELQTQVNEFDVVITCTNAPEVLFDTSNFTIVSKRLLVDLSVPVNIHPALKQMPGVELVNVDDISVALNETIDKRLSDLPKAEKIVQEHIALFTEWLSAFRHSKTLKVIKNNLLQLSLTNYNCNESIVTSMVAENTIEHTVSSLMVNLKTNKDKGCHVIMAYQDFFSRQSSKLYHA